MEKNKNQVISMGNVNYSKMTKDGDIADSGGISGRYYPYITTAKASEAVRVGVVANKNIVAMTVFRGKFVEIDGAGCVYYNGAPVGSVATDGMGYSDVQFAAINTKLVIMPFGKYLDCGDENDVSVKSLGAKITTTTATTFTAKSVSLEGEAAQSYRMIGGYIDENRFAANTRDSVVNFGDSSRKYLWIEWADGYRELRTVELLVKSYAWTSNTIHAYTGPEDREKISKGLYVVDPADSANTKKIKATAKLMEDPYGDGYGYTVITLHDATLRDQSGIERQLELYVASDNILWSEQPTGGVPARLNIKNRYGASYAEVLGTAKVAYYGLNFYPYTNTDIAPLHSGLYTGTIDNGGWGGDFRDFLSDGREVTLEYTNDKDENVSVSGTVGTVEQGAFSVKSTKEDTKVGVEWTEDEISSVITLTASENKNASLGVLFKVGDVVNISGCSIAENNIDFKIDSIGEDGKTLYAASDIFTATPDVAAVAEESGEAGLVIERRIPTLDYICESDNRLYGCSNEDNTIYVSALGDPTNIYTYQGISTDSFAVPVASEEPFTGCCPYDGGVLFWKENKLHKLLGSYPAEYALYTYNIDGVEKGSHKSLQNIGEVLYYKGVRGVFAFNGSPQLISSNFGDKHFSAAVAGNDGEHYLISMKDDGGKYHFFSYNTRSGLWVREGDGCVTAFARQGKDVYMLECDEDDEGDEGGEICRYGAVESSKDSEWFVQFTPIYETIEGQKSYSRIKLRIELPIGSHIVISVRCDGGRWAECGKIVGRVDGVVPVMVPINRCDKFELRIEGKGPFVIHSILREYYVAADNR